MCTPKSVRVSMVETHADADADPDAEADADADAPSHSLLHVLPKSPPPPPPPPPCADCCAFTARMAATLALLGALTCYYNVPAFDMGIGYTLANRVNRKSRNVVPRGVIPMRLIHVAPWGEAERNGSRPLSNPRWKDDIRNVNKTREHLDMPGMVFSDEDCIRIIRRSRWHQLEAHFLAETYGAYKSDICRSIALYEHGGIYMDNDVGLLHFDPRTLFPRLNADFVSSAELKGGTGVWNAFIAASAGHPVLATQLDEMRKWYVGTAQTSACIHKSKGKTIWMMGPCTLGLAVQAHLGSSAIYLLTEAQLPFWRGMPTASYDVGAALRGCYGVVVFDPGYYEEDFLANRAYGMPILISKTPGGAGGRQSIAELIRREALIWLAIATAVATLYLIYANLLRRLRAK